MSKISLYAGIMLIASAVFIACDKKDDPAKQQARLLVANAAVSSPVSPSPLPTAGPAVDVRWDRQFIIPNVIYGAASVTTGSPVTSVSTAQFITATYAGVKPGAFGLNLAVAGQGGSNGVTIYDRTTSLLPGKSYTAVAFDFTPLYRVHLMEDDLSAPAAGKAKVRFLHTIPPNILASVPRRDTIDLTFTGGTVAAPLSNTAIYSLRNFGDAFQNQNLTRFTALDSGRYNIGIRIAGTPGTAPASGLLGLFPSLRLVEGKIYTIIARVNIPGLVSSQPAALTIIQHN
jgi:hypothetical protein